MADADHRRCRLATSLRACYRPSCAAVGWEEVVRHVTCLSGPRKIFASTISRYMPSPIRKQQSPKSRQRGLSNLRGESIFRITCCSCERQAALHRLSGYDGHRLATSTRSRVNFLRFDIPATLNFSSGWYDSFNARDIEAALASMHPDVIWANGLEGGHVHGRDGVRDYWTRQWAMMDSRAEPTGFSIGEDGTVYVEVHLTARDLHGNASFDEKASHVFQIEDGLIRRLISASSMSGTFTSVRIGRRLAWRD